MLQKELIKRLKGKYETKMDDKGWLNFSSDGILLCKVKYNGNCIINDAENLPDEYREKIAGIQDEVLTVREYIGLYERAPQMKAAGVTEYKQLASFGDTVLAATYNEKNGFMFCTWKQNADGDSVFWGDYSPNYLTSAAEHGNQYAEQLLHSIKNNKNWSATMGSIRLLHHLARMFQNRLEDERKDKMGGIDRKLKRKIDEKKQAHGLKQ